MSFPNEIVEEAVSSSHLMFVQTRVGRMGTLISGNLLRGRLDNLTTASFILFSLTMAGNAANYFFQFVMGRSLSVADFGAMNALLSLATVISVPAVTLTLTTARMVAALRVQGRPNDAATLYARTCGKAAVVGGVVLLSFIFLSPGIAGFLRISATMPVVLVGVMVLFSLLVPVNLGLFQGFQDFWALGIFGSLGGLLRLALGVVFVMSGLALYGAIWAAMLTPAIVFFAGTIFARRYFAAGLGSAGGGSQVDVRRTLFPTALATSLLYSMTFLDIVLVKHLFRADLAGVYAAVAILGRTVLYLPAAVAQVLLPKVAEADAMQNETRALLKKAVMLTLVISAPAMALFVLFPEPVLSMLFGGRYVEGAELLRFFSVAMVPHALLSVLVSYFVAKGSFRFVYVLGAVLLVQMLAIYWLAKALPHVVLVMGLTGFGVFCLLYLGNFEEQECPVR